MGLATLKCGTLRSTMTKEIFYRWDDVSHFSFHLPLFFVYSALNTRVGLLNSLTLWGINELARNGANG
jgi:hypothetical protein